MREIGQRRQRIAEGRLLRPRPEEQHHRIGDDDHRQQHAPEAGPGEPDDGTEAACLRAAPQHEEQQRQPEIAEEQQAADAHAQGEARREPELRDERPARPRQLRHDPHEVVDRPDHAHREGHVLRVVEHLAVVVGDQQQEERGDEAGARAGERAAELPDADETDGRRRDRSGDGASRRCRRARPD